MDMVVGMGWDGNGGAQGRTGMFWRRSSQVGQSLKLGFRALQGFPRGAAAADDDGCRLCGVRTLPASVVVDGVLPRTSTNRATCNSRTYVQDLDSIKFSVHDTEVQLRRHHPASLEVIRVTSTSSAVLVLVHSI